MILKYTKADERDIAVYKPIYERYIHKEFAYDVFKLYLDCTTGSGDASGGKRVYKKDEATHTKIADWHKRVAGSWSSLATFEWLLHRDINKFQAYLRRAFRFHRTSFEMLDKEAWVGPGLDDLLPEYWACGAWDELREGWHLLQKNFEKRGFPDPLSYGYNIFYLEPQKPVSFFEKALEDDLKEPFQDKSYDGWKKAFRGVITCDSTLWHAGMKDYLRYFKSTDTGRGELFCLDGISAAMVAKARGLDVNLDHRLAPAELQIPYSVPPDLEATYPTACDLFVQAYERDIAGRKAPRALCLYTSDRLLEWDARDAGKTEEQLLEERATIAHQLYAELKAGTFPFKV